MPGADAWVVSVDLLAATGRLGGYRDLLSPEERQRLDAFHFDADQLAYLAAHGLARTALSLRAPQTPPHAWRFHRTRYGRPEIDAPAPTRLTFNISHTRRAVACIVTDDLACGIDVEHTDGAADVDLLARGVLTADERAALRRLDDQRRRIEFFRYWTLKEAYVKARGVGMSLPLDGFGFDLSGSAIGFHPATPPDSPDSPAAGDPGSWQFHQWVPADATVAAVALRTDGDRCELVRHGAPPPLGG